MDKASSIFQVIEISSTLTSWTIVYMNASIKSIYYSEMENSDHEHFYFWYFRKNTFS